MDRTLSLTASEQGLVGFPANLLSSANFDRLESEMDFLAACTLVAWAILAHKAWVDEDSVVKGFWAVLPFVLTGALCALELLS